MNELRAFMKEEAAVSTVEIILIVIVLIALVVIFKGQISTIVTKLMTKATEATDEFTE